MLFENLFYGKGHKLGKKRLRQVMVVRHHTVWKRCLIVHLVDWLFLRLLLVFNDQFRYSCLFYPRGLLTINITFIGSRLVKIQWVQISARGWGWGGVVEGQNLSKIWFTGRRGPNIPKLWQWYLYLTFVHTVNIPNCPFKSGIMMSDNDNGKSFFLPFFKTIMRQIKYFLRKVFARNFENRIYFLLALKNVVVS